MRSIPFARRLADSLSQKEPASHLQQLLRETLVPNVTSPVDPDDTLTRIVAERIDVTAGNTRRMLALANDVERLLTYASSDAAVELLLELIAERRRTATVIRRHLEGLVSRTAFLSFVSEQRWPATLKRSVEVLATNHLASLCTALDALDVQGIERIVVTSS